MNKKAMLVTSVIALAIVSCASGSKSGNPVVDALNARLAKFSIDGYQAGRMTSQEEWNKMVTLAVPVVKEILPKVPSGYNLQVTGHTDGEGGINSAKNINLSTQRALQVWLEMRRRGITDQKFTYKGVAGTIPSKKCGIKEPCQRRVSFLIVSK